MVYSVIPMAEIRQDFEKWFSVSRKGVKNEAFPIEILAFKIFIFSVFQNHHFTENFQKIMFYHLYFSLVSVLSIVYTDSLIFDSVICISLKVPLIRILLSIGSWNGKNCLLEGRSRFLSILPFVNLQIEIV